MQFPLTLKPDQNGTIIAQAIDVPGALTVGHDETDAVAQVVDALITLFACFISDGEPIPRPSPPKRGQPVAVLPPQVTAKLAIYQAMRDAGLTQLALAERLGCDPRQVRRLLDLDHRSRLDQLEAALTALGSVSSSRFVTPPNKLLGPPPAVIVAAALKVKTPELDTGASLARLTAPRLEDAKRQA